jgi:hypothetical protein
MLDRKKLQYFMVRSNLLGLLLFSLCTHSLADNAMSLKTSHMTERELFDLIMQGRLLRFDTSPPDFRFSRLGAPMNSST